MPGAIQFISLGPGDPELITLKGLKALQAADVIFCPETELADGRKLSRAAGILHGLAIAEESIRRFRLPMDKCREEALKVYDAVYADALLLHREKKQVCIVAEGDAGLYASIHYVYDRLSASGIPVEHVPGIPAFIAAGARGGLHVASGEQRLTIVPGNITAEEIAQLVESNGSVVIMKLSMCSSEVHRCIRLHPEYRYHYFENVGMRHERCLDDRVQIAGLDYPYFSIMVIGR